MTETSSPLHMVQLEPDIQKTTAWMTSQPRRIVRPGHDDGYGWHALLAAAFGDLAPRPFRIVERRGEPVRLLAYTEYDRSALIDAARLQAEPAVYAALRIDGLAAKPMPATFRAGQRLGFEVRVRPTVRQDRDGNRRRSRERDAFLAALDAESRQRGERPEIVREIVYRDWLARRLAPAASLESGSFQMAELKRTMVLRPLQRGEGETGGRTLRPVGLLHRNAQGEQGGSPDATVHGVLTVLDPAAFQALLARGVGRHLAFGFGMLLLRPDRRG